ncbi:MAG TPA: hypothetical protein VHQ92_01080 [Pseudolabrys sp.]|nr:hypothetical protein [Pseudolabrys sp.]
MKVDRPAIDALRQQNAELRAALAEKDAEIVQLSERCDNISADAESELKGAYARAETAEAALATCRTDFERECADTDKLLAALGIIPDGARTEGGSLRIPTIMAVLNNRNEELAACRGERDAAVVDAERYRWLRSSAVDGDHTTTIFRDADDYEAAYAHVEQMKCEDDLDAAIDAAIRASKEAAGGEAIVIHGAHSKP